KVNRMIAVGARGTVDAAALPIQGLPPGDYVLSLEAKSGSRSEKREAAFTMGSFDTAPVAEATAPSAAPTGGVSESALYERYFSSAVASDALIGTTVEAMTVGTPGPQVGTENMSMTTDAKRRFL